MEVFGRALSSNLQRFVGRATPALSTQCNNVSLSSVRKTPVKSELEFEELASILEFENASLIDVRSPKEILQYGSIPGAVNIPLAEVKDTLQLPDYVWYATFKFHKPDRNDPNLIFFARGPNASSAAVEIAHKLGFKKSRQYTGGWEDYCNKLGVPLKKSAAM